MKRGSPDEPLRAIVARLIATRRWSESVSFLCESSRALWDADRVSFLRVEPNARRGNLEYVSSQRQLDRNSPFVNQAEEFVGSFVGSRDDSSAPLASDSVCQEFANAQGMASAVLVPLTPQDRLLGLGRGDGAAEARLRSEAMELLLVEWADSNRFRSSIESLEFSIPWLRDSWLARRGVLRTQVSYDRLKRIAGFVLVVAFVIYLLLPTTLEIEAKGTVQPKRMATIYATHDGSIDEVIVQDGDRVEVGQALLKITSPTLQIELVQLESELRQLDEKRSSLEVSLNQLSSGTPQASLISSRLAGEIEEINRKRESVEVQIGTLRAQVRDLDLKSPIAGVVLSVDTLRHLKNRPVHRGEAIMRVAALDSGFQFEVKVSEWDAGVVKGAWDRAAAIGDEYVAPVFVLSDLGMKSTGRIASIGSSLQFSNGSNSLEVLLEPTVETSNNSARNWQPGNAVLAKIPCGRRARWYVWFRPLIDGLYRRFWI